MSETNDDQREYVYKCVTIKRPYSNKPIFREDIVKIEEKHLKDTVILDQTYEIDKSWVLHGHYLVMAEKDWCPKKIRYWTIKSVVCTNREGWLSYIHKEASNQDEQDMILLDHESRHVCLFD